MPNSPELERAQVKDPFQGDLHIRASIEDMVGYLEETVSAAAYNERIVEIMEPVVLDDNPCMDPSDFRELKAEIEDEYGLSGDDLTRALYRCAMYIKRINGIAKVVD